MYIGNIWTSHHFPHCLFRSRFRCHRVRNPNGGCGSCRRSFRAFEFRHCGAKPARILRKTKRSRSQHLRIRPGRPPLRSRKAKKKLDPRRQQPSPLSSNLNGRKSPSRRPSSSRAQFQKFRRGRELTKLETATMRSLRNRLYQSPRQKLPPKKQSLKKVEFSILPAFHLRYKIYTAGRTAWRKLPCRI